MCAAIEAGRIDFDAVASTDTSPGFLPVANLPRFRRAFESRLRAGAPSVDAPPRVGGFEGPFVEDEPTPSSSAQLVVPVPDATGAAPPGLVMVPGLLDESDEHDQDATSDNASTGHITDRDTLIGGDASEGHDTFIQGTAPADATADLDAERAQADAIADRADAAAFGVGGFGEASDGAAANRDGGLGEPGHRGQAPDATFGARDEAALRTGAAFRVGGSDVPPPDSDPDLRTAFGAPSDDTALGAPSDDAADGDPSHDAAFSHGAADGDPSDDAAFSRGPRTFARSRHDVPSLDSDSGLRSAFAPAGHAPAGHAPSDREAGPRTAFAGHDVPSLDSDPGLRTAFAPAGHAPAGHAPSDREAGPRTAFAGHDVPSLDSDSGLRTAFAPAEDAPAGHEPSDREAGPRTAFAGHNVPSLDSDAGLRTAFTPAEDAPAGHAPSDREAGPRTAFAGHDVPSLDSDSGLRTAFAPAGHAPAGHEPSDREAGPRTAFAGHDVPSLDSDSGLRTAFAPAGHAPAGHEPADREPDPRTAFAGHDVPSLDSDPGLRTAFAPAEDAPAGHEPANREPGPRTAFAGHDVPSLDSDAALRSAFAPSDHDVPALDSDPGLRTAFAPAGHDVPPLDSDSGLRTAFGVLLDPDTLGPTTDPASPSAHLDDLEATHDRAHGAAPRPLGHSSTPHGAARHRLEDTGDVASEHAQGPRLREPLAADAATARLTKDRLLEDTEDEAPGLTLPRTRVTPAPHGPRGPDGELPTLRPGDATAVGVRTVVGTPDDRDLDTLVGGGLPDGLDMPTDSGVRVTGTDVDEVHPTDTQVAVVHPDEDFQPEDLALTSQDDPMPPEHTPPPADAAPIAHGAIAMPTPAARSMTPLWIVLGAWVLLTATMFFASVARDGGAAEAAWRPASAVLWLRIALTGGVGGLLAFALKRALPVTKQLLRLSWEWAGIAILAGACVGAMAPFSRPDAPLAIALILAATLAIAEEAFFRGVLGRVLAVSPLKNRTAIAIAAILYGLYYGTYFVIWQHDDPLQTALALTMITVGAALPYAILQDLTKGVLAPLLCHVSVNVAGVVVRTYF